MLLAFGVLAALINARNTGTGQLVDAAMVDGAALLMAMTYGMHAQGRWSDQRGVNLLDGGAPFYDSYETSDGKFMAVGAIERKFYVEFVRLLGMSEEELPDQMDRSSWPETKDRFAKAFATRTRMEWERIFEGSDSCVVPVLTMDEAPSHPHLASRGTFVEAFGVLQPSPAPRFSITPGSIQGPPPGIGEQSDGVLADWDISTEMIASYRAERVIG